MIVTAYFGAPVRGAAGDDVDYDVKWANVIFAREIAYAVQGWFPHSLDLFIPHDHEEYIEGLLEYGFTSEQVVEVCCRIAEKKQLGLFYTGRGISGGMEKEIARMEAAGCPLVKMAEVTEFQREQIARAMSELPTQLHQVEQG